MQEAHAEAAALVAELTKGGVEETIELVGRLAELCRSFGDQAWLAGELARHARWSEPLELPGTVPAVASFYLRAGNGGAERVMVDLASLLSEAGLSSTVLVEQLGDDDYELAEGVQTELIARIDWEGDVAGSCRQRYERLAAIIAERGIGACIYHAWIYSAMVFDLIVLRALGVRFILNTHGIFCYPLLATNGFRDALALVARVAAVADEVVSETDVNARYHAIFRDHAWSVPNPTPKMGLGAEKEGAGEGELEVEGCTAAVTAEDGLPGKAAAGVGDASEAAADGAPSPAEGGASDVSGQTAPEADGAPGRAAAHVVWVGRFDELKHPEDAIRALAHAASLLPRVRLRFVGSGDDDTSLTRLKELARELGVSEHIEFAGFQSDVAPHYAWADLLISTSSTEGFSMVLLEASACGVPVAMYDLPYLPFASSAGVRSVPQGDWRALGELMAALLDDGDELAAMSSAARAFYQRFAEFDYVGTWKAILMGDAAGRAEVVSATSGERLLWEVMFDALLFGSAGAERDRLWLEGLRNDLTGQLETERSRREELERELADTWGSVSMKVGRVATAPLRAARDAMGKRHRQ